MPPRDAMAAALALLRNPASVRQARRAGLPPDIPFLLEIANADAAAIEQARRRTGYPDHFLEEAAAFYIEQILLDRHADSYRILGGSPVSSHAELRRNMALMMRWLHPDRKSQRSSVAIDRDVFAGRVSRAWEDLKSDERRSAYDAKRAVAATPPSGAAHRNGSGKPSASRHKGARSMGVASMGRGFMGRGFMRGAVAAPEAQAAGWPRARDLQPVSFWRRILGFLRGRL